MSDSQTKTPQTPHGDYIQLIPATVTTHIAYSRALWLIMKVLNRGTIMVVLATILDFIVDQMAIASGNS